MKKGGIYLFKPLNIDALALNISEVAGLCEPNAEGVLVGYPREARAELNMRPTVELIVISTQLEVILYLNMDYLTCLHAAI